MAVSVQLVDGCGSSVGEAHGHSLQAGGFRGCWVANRSGNRSGRCTRLVEGAVRSLLDGRRSALLGGMNAVACLEPEARACCSLASRWMCVAGAKTGRAFGQPGQCQWRASS